MAATAQRTSRMRVSLPRLPTRCRRTKLQKSCSHREGSIRALEIAASASRWLPDSTSPSPQPARGQCSTVGAPAFS